MSQDSPKVDKCRQTERSDSSLLEEQDKKFAAYGPASRDKGLPERKTHSFIAAPKKVRSMLAQFDIY